MKNVDYAIIGIGAGGLTAAYTFKGFNKKVLLIEKDKPGGECTFTGCIPSKTLISSGKEINILKKYLKYNIDTEEIMKRVKKTIEEVYLKSSEEVLKKEGFQYIKGEAKFKGEHIISVGDNIFYADTIIIATGSEPKIPDIKGLKTVDYLTNRTIFNLDRLPKSLIIIGGGYIGVELAQALSRLGVRVSLIEKNKRLLLDEEKEISKIIKESLINEGVDIYLGYTATEFYNSNDNGLRNSNVIIENKREKNLLKGERVLVALGRKPCIDNLNLKEGNIEFDENGILTDCNLETSSPGVYAVGDCMSVFKFSHIANYQGILAVRNSILPIQKKRTLNNITWGVYTDPEIGRCGLVEEEARKKYGNSIRIYKEKYENIDRAVTDDRKEGFIKLILDKKGMVLGCSVIGENAAEIISSVQIIKNNKINMAKVGNVIMPYPTYSEVLVKIGKRVLVDNLNKMNILKKIKKAP